MTSPDLGFANRLKLAAAATGGTRPSTALTLAQSDLPDDSVQLVGGFTQALDTASLVKLARLSGAKTNLSPTQKSQLDAVGEKYDDVEKAMDSDPRNWLEKTFDGAGTLLANTGHALVDNPVMHGLFTGYDKMLDAVKLPARMLSDQIDGNNDSEIDGQMQAKGYDPNSFGDYVAFMYNQGDSLYHDLDGARSTFGDDMVELAIEAQRDPEGFAQRQAKLPAAQQALLNDPDFEHAYDAVDRQHISPGRDIARVVLPKNLEDGAAFTALSGTLDAAYTILLDPTLVAGKVFKGARALDAAGNAINPLGKLDRATGVGALTKIADAATRGRMRSGLADATDQEGVRKLLATGEDGAPVTAVGAGVKRFLDDADKLRNAPDDATRATIFAGMAARHKALMPLLDEVNGTRVLRPTEGTFDRALVDVNGQGHLATAGKAITTLDDFADYFASTTGLLRLGGGVAAKRELILPGRIALRSRLAASRAERRATVGGRNNAEILDHSKPATILPDESEEAYQAFLDSSAKAGDKVYDSLRAGAAEGKGWTPIKAARAKTERMNRRISTLLPTVSRIDLTAADGTEQVRRFARLYMNKTESDRLAALYAGGDLGQRRQVLNGIIEQTFHASGLSRSEAGLREIEKFRADQADLERRAYGLDGTDVLKSEAGDRHVALHLNQLNTEVTIPNFKSLQYLATKHAVGGYYAKTGKLRAGFYGDGLDKVMQTVKLGWITTGAGGLRNALDEVAGVALTGEVGGAKGLIRGRQMFSAATKGTRETSLAERKAAAAVEGRFGPRIPIMLRGASNKVNDVFVAAGLGKLLSYTKVADLDENAIKYTGELAEDHAAGLLSGAITDTYFADDLAKTIGNDGAIDLHTNGLMAVQVKHDGNRVKNEFGGYKQVEVDGGHGLDNWVNQLGVAFGDAADPAHVALKAIVEGGDALGDVVAYMHSPAMQSAVERFELTQTTRSGRRVVTDADREEAIEEYSQRLIANVTKMVTGRGRQGFSDDLVNKVREWKSQGLRAKAGERATFHEGRQAAVEDQAFSAQEYAKSARAQRDDLHARKGEHDAQDRHAAEADRIREKITEAEADLERARGRAAHDPNTTQVESAAAKLEDSYASVSRAQARVDKWVERRDHAKRGGSAQPERLAELQAKVTTARADLAKARREAAHHEGRVDRAHGGVVPSPDDVPRLEAKLAAHQAKLAEVEGRIAELPHARPTQAELDDARNEAKRAGVEAAKHSNRPADNARAATKARYDEQLALSSGGNVTDQDVARYLRETGEFVQRDVDGNMWVGGKVNGDLAEKLLAGEIPDRSWLKDTVPPEDFPTHAIGKVWLPVNPKHQVGQIAEGYTSILTKAYGKVVTDQVNAISRNPMLTAAYVQARKHVAGYEAHLVKEGMSPDGAEAVARKMARAHAEQLVIKSIDNPQVQTQFSVLARNFWAFQRAQEDWLRRWGRMIRDNPEIVRKAQLGIHGAESAGLVEKDDQGNLSFVYPGSGAMINAFTKLSGVFGVDTAKIPVMPDLRSNLTFLNPSLDNPVGFSGTPVISIPFKTMSAMMGADHPLLTSSMDKVINGDMGAGRSWYEQLLPTTVNRIIQGVVNEDPGSQFASAYTSALANMDAAGRLDDPALAADPTARARFQNDLKSQVHNQMVARALFGFWAPAAPGSPTNDVLTKDGEHVNEPDFAWHKAGLGTLKDEWRALLNTMPYEDALQWWTENHPGELIYATGGARTTVGTDKAQAPATVTAAKWMQDNGSFLDSYGGPGGVATYFMPQGQVGTKGGEYSDVAYRAQLETGIREYKSLDEYFNQLITQNGEAVYYDTKKDYDAAKKRATAVGNKAEVDRIDAEWAAQKDLIYKANPLLQAKNAQYADKSAQDNTVQQLNKLLADPEHVKVLGDQASGVAQLLLAQRTFDAGMASVKGKRGFGATSERDSLKSEYEAATQQVVSQWPGLADLVRGAFSNPD